MFALGLLALAGCADSDPASAPTVVAPSSTSSATATPTRAPTATPVPFEGTLNGIDVVLQGEHESALVLCPPKGWETVFRTEMDALMAQVGPLQINASALPVGVTPSSSPEGFSCNGKLVSASWIFRLEPNMPRVNAGGGTLVIGREVQRGTKVIQSRNDWQPLTVNGHRGIVSGPAWTGDGRFIGGCYAAIFDESTSVMTTIVGLTGTREFCVDIADRIAR